jgi:acetolactate synthase I/II/III large subunit
MTPQITIAQALARALSEAGVRRMFGVPGGGSSLDLIESAAALGIDFVLTRTENAAVMMAGAVAETSGVPGVALVTKGPGVANAANGVAYAALDRAPVLVVTDGFTAAQSAYITHQVFDQRAMLAPVVKGHSRLGGADPVREIEQLLRLACTPPCGPVHVELTGPTARALVDDTAMPAAHARSRYSVGAAAAIDLAAVERVRERIARARCPVVVVGLEARGHAAATRRLIATLGCPVLATYKGKGVVPDDDPQVVGLFTGGTQEAECLERADLLVLVGLDPVEMILQPWPYGKPAVEIAAARHPVHYIEPDAEAIGALGPMLDMIEEGLRHHARGWAAADMAELARGMRERLAYGAVERGVAPDRIAQLAAQACERRGLRARLSVDAGAHMFSATTFFPSHAAGDILISNGLATMAFALPAAIAAALDDRSRPVLCFTGDGGLLMCLGELSTAVAAGVPVVVIVFNDAALSQIGIKQHSRGLPERGVRWERQQDFAQVMEALGGTGFTARDEAQYQAALDAALASGRPCLIDVEVDPVGYGGQLKAMRG